jgi:hypothetical protein
MHGGSMVSLLQMETDMKDDDFTTERAWFIAGACVLLFVAMCAICAAA